MPGMDIAAIKTQIDSEIQNINSSEALEEFRLKYLARKGIIAQLTSTIPNLPPEERARFGQEVNALKKKILSFIEEKQRLIFAGSSQTSATLGDITMPGMVQELGHLHPLTQVIDEICTIFNRMGFSVVEGPEIETEYNNFTGLNIPLEHPSRDVFDTFYLKLGVRSEEPGVKNSQLPTPNSYYAATPLQCRFG